MSAEYFKIGIVNKDDLMHDPKYWLAQSLKPLDAAGQRRRRIRYLREKAEKKKADKAAKKAAKAEAKAKASPVGALARVALCASVLMGSANTAASQATHPWFSSTVKTGALDHGSWNSCPPLQHIHDMLKIHLPLIMINFNTPGQTTNHSHSGNGSAGKDKSRLSLLGGRLSCKSLGGVG